MIITICGSARFEKYFHLWNEVLTLSGHTIFGLSVYPSYKNGQKNWYTEKEKIELDKAHFRKIDASDAIIVINKFAYLGESTLNEIKYAQECGKELYILESWGKGNGVGGAHNISYQKMAQLYNCLGKGSPIDTLEPEFQYAFNLLPSAGEYRNNLVDKIYNIELRKNI